MSSLALVRQPAKDKEKFEFKPAVLHLKIYLVPSEYIYETIIDAKGQMNGVRSETQVP